MDTPAEVLAEMQKQIDWRGPTGRSMGHVVITREQATVLLDWLKSQEEIQKLVWDRLAQETAGETNAKA